MNFTNIKVETQNSDEKTMLVLALVLPIMVGFLAPLIIYFAMTDKLSETTKEAILAMLNFQIIVVIAYIALSIVPIIGWMCVPLVSLANLIICIIAMVAAVNNTAVKIPMIYEFIKPQKNEQ